MEGRPPPFDPDDELDFDFDDARRRYSEREESTAERRVRRPFPEEQSPSEEDPYAGEEYPSQEFPSDELDDPFAADRTERRERPRRRGRFAIRLGRRRRSDTAERRARPRTDDPAAIGAPAGATEVGADPGTGEQLLRDDPYTPSEGPAPRTRRQHRRDLPAKVRRRQALGIGAVALAVVVGGFVLLGGGGGGEEDEGLPVKKLVGQSFVGRIGADGANPELLKKVRKGQLGGVFISQDISDQTLIQQSIDQLQQAAEDGGNPPLLVMIDQEGDPIKTIDGPPDISPRDLGESGDVEVARGEGEKTGSFLAGPGVNVDLAPVLDVAIERTTADTIADRTYGEDPALVSGIGAAFIEGLQSQGVAATAKHFPGLGPATINTDFAPVTVVAQQEDLDAALQPFQAAVDAGVDLVMMSSAAYPDYAGATPGKGKVKPAVFAEPIVQGMLRQELGFQGLIITDDLESIAIKTLTNRDVAAVAALGAGCDLVLYARSLTGVTQGFNRAVQAVKQGKLDEATLQESYDRITRLKGELATS